MGGDDDESIIYNLMLYHADRLASEAASFTPFGAYAEGKKLWSSPVAIEQTINDLIGTTAMAARFLIEEDFKISVIWRFSLIAAMSGEVLKRLHQFQRSKVGNAPTIVSGRSVTVTNLPSMKRTILFPFGNTTAVSAPYSSSRKRCAASLLSQTMRRSKTADFGFRWQRSSQSF